VEFLPADRLRQVDGKNGLGLHYVKEDRLAAAQSGLTNALRGKPAERALAAENQGAFFLMESLPLVIDSKRRESLPISPWCSSHKR
jgi:hypothetical protein